MFKANVEGIFIRKTTIAGNDRSSLGDGHSEPRNLLLESFFWNTFAVHHKDGSDQSCWHDPNMLLQDIRKFVAKIIVEC